jgi:glucose-6-phosphate dehydrogenase assembly protein OpcA
MTARSDGKAEAPIAGLTAVAVAKIEDALADRRRSMLAKMGQPSSRTCVMTLVIAVENERENQSSFDIINQLAGKYPIRAIVLGHTQKEHDALAAWVNLACEGQDSRAICSEEIILQGGAGSSDRVVSSVRSLIRSDLPVMLWWRGGVPFPSTLWRGLFSICDRVIVDSHRFAFDLGGMPDTAKFGLARPDGRSALAVLRELVRQAGERACVRDLNWQRTAPWRAAIATCFDDRDVLALLPKIDRCSLTFADPDKDAPPSARALLMAGWLMDRLPCLQEHCIIGGGKNWASVQPGRVVAITLTSSVSKASVVLIRQSSPTGVRAQANAEDGKPMRRWDFGAATLTEAELLDAAMETLGRDTMFENVLSISI